MNANGETPLFVATRYSSINSVSVLLQHPLVDINQSDIYGSTPLHNSVQCGHIRIISLLLSDPRILINKQNRDGNAAIHTAVLNDSAESLFVLFEQSTEHPIDVNIKNNKGETPLYLATLHNKIRSLHALMTRDDLELNAFTDEGMTPLGISAEKKHIEILLTLLGEVKLIREMVQAYIGNLSSHLIDAIFRANSKISNCFLSLGHQPDSQSRVLQMAMVYVDNILSKTQVSNLFSNPLTSPCSPILEVTYKSPAPSPSTLSRTNSKNAPSRFAKSQKPYGGSSGKFGSAGYSSSTTSKFKLLEDNPTNTSSANYSHSTFAVDPSSLDSFNHQTDNLCPPMITFFSPFNDTEEFGNLRTLEGFHAGPFISEEVLFILRNKPLWTKLTLTEINAIYDARFGLLWHPEALPYFLKSVNWSDNIQSQEAMFLAEQWHPIKNNPTIPINILLAPEFRSVAQVRSLAVDLLEANLTTRRTSLLFLSQLVQGLRYSLSPTSKDPLFRYLLQSAQDSSFYINLYWNIKVESDHIKNSASDDNPFIFALNQLCELPTFSTLLKPGIKFLNTLKKTHDMMDSPNKQTYIEQYREILGNHRFANCFVPCAPTIFITELIPEQSSVFTGSAMKPWLIAARSQPVSSTLSITSTNFFLDSKDITSTCNDSAHSAHSANSRVQSSHYSLNDTNTNTNTDDISSETSSDVSRTSRSSSSDVPSDEFLNSRSERTTSVSSKTSVLSTDTDISDQDNQSDPEPDPEPETLEAPDNTAAADSTLSLSPTVQTPPPPPSIYRFIFKCGDDLRQDQLACQIVNVMSIILAPLKLSLTPYAVLPTGPDTGLCQFLPDCATLTDILNLKKNKKLRGPAIHAWWKTVEGGDPNTKNGIKKSIMDKFVRSVAGSCVFNYILGIGDRHNENSLISSDGRFLHIDFGFIFGRDPKFQVAFKLTKPMAEAMDNRWTEFQRVCCRAFLLLRKRHNANLIMTLCASLLEANLPDLVVERLDKMRSRFHFEMTNEEAKDHFKYLIESTLKSKKALLSETSHSVARILKKYTG